MYIWKKKLFLSAALVALIPASAMAQDGLFKKSAGDFFCCVERAVGVIPSEKGDVTGVGNDALTIDNSVVPEFVLTYF